MILKYQDIINILKERGLSEYKFTARDYDEDFEGIAVIFKGISPNKTTNLSMNTFIQIIVRFKNDFPKSEEIAEKIIEIIELEGIHNINCGSYGISYIKLIDVVDLRSENGFDIFSITLDCKIRK